MAPPASADLTLLTGKLPVSAFSRTTGIEREASHFISSVEMSARGVRMIAASKPSVLSEAIVSLSGTSMVLHSCQP